MSYRTRVSLGSCIGKEEIRPRYNDCFCHVSCLEIGNGQSPIAAVALKSPTVIDQTCPHVSSRFVCNTYYLHTFGTHHESLTHRHSEMLPLGKFLLQFHALDERLDTVDRFLQLNGLTGDPVL